MSHSGNKLTKQLSYNIDILTNLLPCHFNTIWYNTWYISQYHNTLILYILEKKYDLGSDISHYLLNQRIQNVLIVHCIEGKSEHSNVFRLRLFLP